MDRNKWDTAIRCLEVALHPHTGDAETIAAVNGFRRTARGMPLSAICAAAEQSQGQRERLARLTLANRDLAARLDAATQRIAALERERVAATARAERAERRVAELRAAHVPLMERRRDPPERMAPSHAPFEDMLAAAMGRTPAARSASPARFPWRA